MLAQLSHFTEEEKWNLQKFKKLTPGHPELGRETRLPFSCVNAGPIMVYFSSSSGGPFGRGGDHEEGLVKGV